MELFIAFDGDSIGAQAGKALLEDDVSGVRQVSRAIESGEELWKNWAVTSGGEVVSAGGDEGCVKVPADKLSEVDEIRVKYHTLVNATCSVGVGLRISEAAKALMIAKLRGKDRIILWNQEMQAELDDAKSKPESEQEKIADHYLTKADGTNSQQVDGRGEHHNLHVGVSHHRQPSKPHKDPKSKDHDPAKEAIKTMEAAKSTVSPEQTHAAEDFEDTLHSAAQQQDKDDASATAQSDTSLNQIKQQLVQTLSQIKGQMPVMLQMKQAAPEAYQSIMNLVSGVIALGKEVMKDQPQVEDMGKSEDLEKSVANIIAGAKIKSPFSGEHPQVDYSHVLPAGAKENGYSLLVTHVPKEKHPSGNQVDEHLLSSVHFYGKKVGEVTGYINDKGKPSAHLEPHSELDSKHQNKGLGSAMYEALYAHAKNHLGINEVAGGAHTEKAHKVHQRLAQKHGFEYSAPASGLPYTPHGRYNYSLKAELEDHVPDHEIIGPGKGVTFIRSITQKDEMQESPASGKEFDKALGAKGGIAGKPTHSHLFLPVGSIKDNKIKVQHSDGKVSFVEASSGMVQSQDAGSANTGAEGHPASSRKPMAQ